MADRPSTAAVLLGLIDALAVVLETNKEMDQFLQKAAKQHDLRRVSGPNKNQLYDGAGLRNLIGKMYGANKRITDDQESLTNPGMVFKHGSDALEPEYLASIGYTKRAGQEAQPPADKGKGKGNGKENAASIAASSSNQASKSTKRPAATDVEDAVEAPPAKRARLSTEEPPAQRPAADAREVGTESGSPQPRYNILPLFPSTFIGDSRIQGRVDTLQQQAMGAAAVFLDSNGAHAPNDVQIVVEPSRELRSLYARVFGEADYQMSAAKAIAEDKTSTLMLLQSMIAAYLVDEIFHKPLPWLAPHHLLDTRAGKQLALVLFRQDLRSEEVIRQASHELVFNDKFQKETLEPEASSRAMKLFFILMPHLKLYRRSGNDIFSRTSTDLIARLSEICTNALMLHAQMDAAPHTFSVLWPLKQAFERATMIQQSGSIAGGEVAMVLFPGFHCRPSDLNMWSESTSARTLVSVPFRRPQSPEL